MGKDQGQDRLRNLYQGRWLLLVRYLPLGANLQHRGTGAILWPRSAQVWQYFGHHRQKRHVQGEAAFRCLGGPRVKKSQEFGLLAKEPVGAQAVKLTDGNNVNLTKFAVLDRGCTAHEHLQGVELTPMSGRFHDAMLHRFLTPDSFVQDP